MRLTQVEMQDLMRIFLQVLTQDVHGTVKILNEQLEGHGYELKVLTVDVHKKYEVTQQPRPPEHWE